MTDAGGVSFAAGWSKDVSFPGDDLRLKIRAGTSASQWSS